MKERLIAYSAPMVRAKRAGLKTQTRRVAKLNDSGRVKLAGSPRNWHCEDPDAWQACPYGAPGDILLTREAWRTLAIYDATPPRDIPIGTPIWYEADGGPVPLHFGRYRHARFMCRWMCRDRDEITAVRVERLQDISEADAVAEGAPLAYLENLGNTWRSHRRGFELLWEQINGPGSWDANPWAWVIEFRRVTG